MYIKVACACGCRYGFDVVPVNGLMPVGVNCPKCGLDGTFKADSLIALATPKKVNVPAVTPGVLAGIPLPADPEPASSYPTIALPPPPPAAVPLPPSRPPAVALSPITGLPINFAAPVSSPAVATPSPAVAITPPPAVAAAPPSPPAPVSGLSVKRRAPEAHTAPPSLPASLGSASAEPASPGLQVKGVVPSSHTTETPVATPGFKPLEPEPVAEKKLADPHVHMSYMPKDGPTPSFPRGLLGAFIGTVVGALIWFAIYYFGEIDFGWLAFIPAVTSGMLGRKMAREDNHWIGVAAAIFTVLAIFSVRYAVLTHEIGRKTGPEDSTAFHSPSYDERMAEAKEAVAAQTDDQIRNFIQNQNRREFEKYAGKGEKYEPEGVTNEEVKEFKDSDLKGFQDFANGKPSRAEYEKELQNDRVTETWITRIGTALLVVVTTGLLGIIPLIIAICIAYRTGSG